MYKKLILIITVFILLLFSSCSSGGGNRFKKFLVNDRDRANQTFEKVLEAIQNKDKEALLALFSENVRNECDLEDSVDCLLDFFQGEFVSYFSEWGSPMVHKVTNGDFFGDNQKFFESTYDIETSQQKYRFAIEECRVYDADPKNIGICSLYIILAENTDEEFAYWGDGKWTLGINIDTEHYFFDD